MVLVDEGYIYCLAGFIVHAASNASATSPALVIFSDGSDEKFRWPNPYASKADPLLLTTNLRNQGLEFRTSIVLDFNEYCDRVDLWLWPVTVTH